MSVLAATWRQRPLRERRALAWAAAALVAILVFSLAWLPLHRARERLAAELPQLRASIAGLERDAAEVARLRSQPVVVPTAGAPLAALATNAGGLPGAQVAVLDARRVRVTGADVGFAPLLEWIRNAQATHGMRVESARIEALPVAGRVRAELLLARS
jgi:type II secretory pathway component PulM